MKALYKIAWMVAFSVLTVSLPAAWLIAMALALVVTMLVFKANPMRLWRMLLPALPFIIIISIMQALLQDMSSALVSSARILLLYIGGSVVTSTTGESELVMALEKILRIFGRTVARDLSTMVGLSITFIPVVREEYESIKMAQEARGVSFKGLKALSGIVSIAVPLLYSLADRADNIAMAMEARCYGLK
jgi:energy-coupling factor transport system permease protein